MILLNFFHYRCVSRAICLNQVDCMIVLHSFKNAITIAISVKITAVSLFDYIVQLHCIIWINTV